LNERLEDCRARSQLLVLDCCHSGAFARGAKGDAELALKHRFEPSGRGRVVFTASRDTEYSFERDHASGGGARSVFTRAIVEGLRTGDADRDKDGLITVTDLYQYVYDKVRAAESRQRPELWLYGAEGNLLVAHSIRGANTEPLPLPEDLRITLESPRPRVRETGVVELAELLGAADPGLALSAQRMLQGVADRDHPQVAELARVALKASPAAAAEQVQQVLTDRSRRGKEARQKAEEQVTRQEEHQVYDTAETKPSQAPRDDTKRRTGREQAPKAPRHGTDSSARAKDSPEAQGSGIGDATTLVPGVIKARVGNSRRFTDPDQQYFWTRLAVLILFVFFIAGVAGYQLTSPRTTTQVLVGWIMGLSAVGACMAGMRLAFIRKQFWERQILRAWSNTYLYPGETVDAQLRARTVTPWWDIAGSFSLDRVLLVTSRRILALSTDTKKKTAWIVAVLPRSTRLDPSSGRRHVISVGSEQLRVRGPMIGL
jgi:hypothetical protein